jgi:hypothetical protein
MNFRERLYYALGRIEQGTGKKVVAPNLCGIGGRGVGARGRLPGGRVVPLPAGPLCDSCVGRIATAIGSDRGHAGCGLQRTHLPRRSVNKAGVHPQLRVFDAAHDATGGVE